MTKFELIHSLNLEELAYFLTTTKVAIVKGTAERLGYEIEISEETQTETLENTKKFLEGEVLRNETDKI